VAVNPDGSKVFIAVSITDTVLGEVLVT